MWIRIANLTSKTRTNSHAIEEAQKFIGRRSITYYHNKKPIKMDVAEAAKSSSGLANHPVAVSDAKTLVHDRTGGRLDLYNKMSKNPPQGASFEIKQSDGIMSYISKESHVINSKEPSFQLGKFKHSPTPTEDMQRATGINIKDMIFGFKAYCYSEYKYSLKVRPWLENEESGWNTMNFLKGQLRQSLKRINDGSEVLSQITRKLYNNERVSWSLMTQITQADHDLVKAEAIKLENLKSTVKIPDDQLAFVKECHKESNALVVDANDKYVLYNRVESAHKLCITETRRLSILRTLFSSDRSNNAAYRTAQAAANYKDMDYDEVITPVE